MQNRFTWAMAVAAATGLLFACASQVGAGDAVDADAGAPDPGASHDSGAQDSGKKPGPGSTDAGTSATDAPHDDGSTDAATTTADAAPAARIVYGATADTLYTYDLDTQTLASVGKFSGTMTAVADLAVDGSGNAFVTTFDGFYSVDLTSAACTLVKSGGYPNSLAFVPKGTLDSAAEALVGYSGSSYLRIDTVTGDITPIGMLSDAGYSSSGDVVAVDDGGAFLTVTGNGCSDCLLQVDPTTGAMIQNYGSVGHDSVWGVAFYAGSLYGFDGHGDLFAIEGLSDGGIATTDLVTDGGALFYGAGSPTNVPLTTADGGKFPTE